MEGTLFEWLTWDEIWKFANTSFGAALVAGGLAALLGSWAGAKGGARGIQKESDKARRRQVLIDEIKACNAAVDAAGTICNLLLDYKVQHLEELKRSYEEQRAAVRQYAMGVKSGRIVGRKLDLGGIDYGRLPGLRLRTEQLENIVMDKLSVSGRLRGLVSMALQSIDGLREMNEARNRLVDEFGVLEDQSELIGRLFGLPIAGGIDERYRDCIEGLWQYSNNVIYATSEICMALTKHGQKTERRFEQEFKGIHPRTSHVDFSAMMARGLAPPKEHYAGFEGRFIEMVTRTEGRKWSQRWCVARKLGRRALRRPWDRERKLRRWDRCLTYAALNRAASGPGPDRNAKFWAASTCERQSRRSA